jgi:hypothetical protein
MLHVGFSNFKGVAVLVFVLRRVANRSLIKDITARDLERRNMETVLGRVEEAVRQAVIR